MSSGVQAAGATATLCLSTRSVDSPNNTVTKHKIHYRTLSTLLASLLSLPSDCRLCPIMSIMFNRLAWLTTDKPRKSRSPCLSGVLAGGKTAKGLERRVRSRQNAEASPVVKDRVALAQGAARIHARDGRDRRGRAPAQRIERWARHGRALTPLEDSLRARLGLTPSPSAGMRLPCSDLSPAGSRFSPECQP
jgi:hypothetical protein